MSYKRLIKMGNKIEDDIKELIKQKTGQTVLIGGMECSKREKMLGSGSCCKGCPSEFPCSKIVGVDLLIMKVLNREKEFSDYSAYKKQEEYFTFWLDRIIEAKTSKELKDIIKEFSIV